MNKFSTHLSAAVLALVGGMAASTSAHAGWTFTNVNNAQSIYDASTTATLNTLVGWSAANGGALTAGLLGAQTSEVGGSGGSGGVPTNSGANGFAAGASWVRSTTQLYMYGSGIGMLSDGSVAPDHAIDNGPATDANGKITGIGNTEAVYLGFDKAVSLNSISLGYTYNDADISVFRYVGGSSSFGATSLSGMAAAGWELVGNYADLVAGNNSINTGNLTSSGWLISAYNSAYGTGAGLDQGNDYFKLLAVSAGTSCGKGTAGCRSDQTAAVPEPTSLALVAIAGLGLYGSRRRRQAALVA